MCSVDTHALFAMLKYYPNGGSRGKARKGNINILSLQTTQ